MPDGAPIRPWLRVDASIFADADMIRAGPWGGFAYLVILTRAKLLARPGGKLAPGDLDPAVLAAACNAAGEAAVADGLARGAERLQQIGVLAFREGWFVLKDWHRHQSDPGHARRQAEYVARKKTGETPRDVTGQMTSHGVNGRHAEMTSRDVSCGRVTLSDAADADAQAQEMTADDVSSRHGPTKRHGDDYGTGRDGTGEPPLPPSEGGAVSSPTVTASDRHALDCVLTKLGAVHGFSPSKLPSDVEEALALRRSLRDGTMSPESIASLLQKHATRFADTISAARAEVRARRREERQERGRAATAGEEDVDADG